MDQADSSSAGGQLQVKAYAKELDAEQHESSIPVMVSIESPLSGMAAAAAQQRRPPVDLVLVLNVQKGRPAPAKWRMLLMQAVEVSLRNLGEKDRLAVLTDSRTRSAQTEDAKYLKEFKLMEVSDEDCRRVQVSAVNKAIRSDTLVVAALELANSMLHNREYEDKENRPAYVIVVSNSDEQDIGSLLAWRFLSAHAFGFRDAHNARTMCAIASSPDCTYALLDDERGRITQAFAACIHRITSAAAAMPIEVKLKCERKIVVAAIDAPRISYFISYEKDAATIWTSAHQVRASTKLIVWLSLRPEGEEKLHHDLLKFFTVHVKYGHITVHAPESSEKLDDKVVPRSEKMMPLRDMLESKFVPESDKLHGRVMAESGNLEWKMMMESNKPDDKVVDEFDRVHWKVVMESDKIHGEVMAEPGNLERKMMMESNKPYEKVVDEFNRVDEKVVMESDKLDGKVMMESGNLESKEMMESNKPDNRVVAKLDKLDEKVVMESDKLHGNMMAESGNLEARTMESNKPDEKMVAELDKLDKKAEMESDKTDKMVVMDESMNPDANKTAQTDKLDGKVVRESNNVNMKVGEESTKLDRKLLVETNKLEGMVVMDSEEPMKPEKIDIKVVAETDKKVVPESDKLDRKVLVWSSKLDLGKVRLKLKVKTIENDGKVVVVKKGEERYKEMAGEIVRIEAVKIVADIAREDRKHHHPVDLANELHERWTTLENSDCGQEASKAGVISMLAQEMQEMHVRLHYDHFWLEYMLSWQSYQWWQLPLPPLFMDKQATNQSKVDPPLELTIFPKDRANPWSTQYTVPRQLKVVVRVAAPGLTRCPVDLIVLLHASRGPEEKRLRLLVKAMELVVSKLDHKDRLAIMHVQSTATKPAAGTSLMAMTDQGKDEISTVLKFLVVRELPLPLAMVNEKAAQTSHWREQLKEAWKLVRKLLNVASVNTSVRTVSTPEGQNAAVESSNLWKALEGAKEILVNRPPAEKEQRAGIIIVISDSNDDSIINVTPGRPDTELEYIVHAVSFRDGGPRNTRAMNHIARRFHGIYAVLDDGQDEITDAFTACINRITSIVAMSTEVTIRCNRDSLVALNNIQSAGQVLHNTGHDVSISAGAFHAGTVRNFIAILDNVGWYEYGMLHKFCIVGVTWRHPLSRKMDTLHGEVYARDSSEVLKEVESSFTVANTVTVVTDPRLYIKLVTDSEALGNDIMIPIEQKLMDKLHRLFHKCSREAGDAGEALLAKEMEKLKENLEKEMAKMHENRSVDKVIDFTFIEELLAEPLSYMLSWLSRNF